MKKALLFTCRKCEHEIFIFGKTLKEKLKKLDSLECCPDCGEESEKNFIYGGQQMADEDDFIPRPTTEDEMEIDPPEYNIKDVL